MTIKEAAAAWGITERRVGRSSRNSLIILPSIGSVALSAGQCALQSRTHFRRI